MKVSIGTNIHDGPWGGGNLFAINLKNYLLEQGHEVTHNILDNDIDIVLLTEPRKTSPSSAYTNYDVDDYITYIILGIIIGGRLGYVFFYNFDFYSKYPIEIIKIWNGGMSFHGGLIGIIISTIFFAKKE